MAEQPTRAQVKRWRQYLANEKAEAAVYRRLAEKSQGSEREILLEIAEAETRHAAYWRDKLGDQVGKPRNPDANTRMLAFFARHFGSVFTLALMQAAEARTPYRDDEDAPAQIAADETMHSEVIRALATRGREEMSGGFRAAVFGANDGLVSNVSLVLGVLGSGMSSNGILLTGISGLLAGALSMAAGEYVSVRSQTELLDASVPDPASEEILPHVDVNANELALVFRARGLDEEEARIQAGRVFAEWEAGKTVLSDHAGHAMVGDRKPGLIAAASSFVCFALGALVPILPFIFGATPAVGAVISLVLVSASLMFTGGITGVLSGKPPAPRAFRQLAIGLGAAAVTYALGRLFGEVLG